VLISATAINHDRVTAEGARAIAAVHAVQPWWEGAPAPARAGESTERPIVDSPRARRLAREARDLARSTAHEARDVAHDFRDAAHEVRDAVRAARDAADLSAIPEAARANIRPIVAPFEGLAPVAAPGLASRVSRLGAELVRDARATVASALNAMQNTSITRSSRGQKNGTFTWSKDGDRIEISYSGDFEFTDDDTDVKSMSPGGSLKIREGGRFRADHIVELRADGSGAIERRYWEGRSEKPFDPDGRRWLATMLPRFIRQTGFAAEKRVARIMKHKGVDGVLAEISLIEGSWAKTVYFKELLKQPNIGNRVPQIFTTAGKEIDGDFELAGLLAANTSFINDEATRKAFLDAAQTIGGDFEMKKVLSAVLSKGQPSAASIAALLEASTNIGGDFELSSLLQEVVKLRPLDATTRAPFFAALATVGGAHERQQVLSAVMKREGQPADVLGNVLEATGQISGDFEASSLLVELAKNHPIEGALREPFFKSTATVQGSFERSRILQAVVDRPDVSEETLLAVIESAGKMSGHFERSQVLLRLARNHTLSRASRDAYIDAANGLGEFEQGQVLSALVRNERRR
jgi:hypothetical protein